MGGWSDIPGMTVPMCSEPLFNVEERSVSPTKWETYVDSGLRRLATLGEDLAT